MKCIINKVVSDRITRERTYDITQTREDKRDALAQLAITVSQMLDEGFTGVIELHCSQGHLSNIKARETQKV